MGKHYCTRNAILNPPGLVIACLGNQVGLYPYGKQLSLIIPRTGDHSDFGPRGQMPQAQLRSGRFTASLVLYGICAPITLALDRVCRINSVIGNRPWHSEYSALASTARTTRSIVPHHGTEISCLSPPTWWLIGDGRWVENHKPLSIQSTGA